MLSSYVSVCNAACLTSPSRSCGSHSAALQVSRSVKALSWIMNALRSQGYTSEEEVPSLSESLPLTLVLFISPSINTSLGLCHCAGTKKYQCSGIKIAMGKSSLMFLILPPPPDHPLPQACSGATRRQTQSRRANPLPMGLRATSRLGISTTLVARSPASPCPRRKSRGRWPPPPCDTRMFFPATVGRRPSDAPQLEASWRCCFSLTCRWSSSCTTLPFTAPRGPQTADGREHRQLESKCWLCEALLSQETISVTERLPSAANRKRVE